MSVRDIVYWPDKRLRQETKQIDEINDEIRELYTDMIDTMYAYNGLGLAAIQIGAPHKMFIVASELVGDPTRTEPWAFINPEVMSSSTELERANEGCLSFPEIFVPIDRPVKSRMKALGIDGEEFEIDGEGLLSRCLLHEFDHLTGKLMVDFVGPLRKQVIKRKLAKRQRDVEEDRDAG